MKKLAVLVITISLSLLFTISLFAEDAEYWYKKGWDYMWKDPNVIDIDSAIKCYNKAIEIDPNYVKSYIGRGLAYAILCKYDEAIADYSKAIELDPNKAYFYESRGDMYYRKGRHEDAKADYKKACDMGHDISCDRLKNYIE
jgi:tetratricopeptide (TPR) repeat protein